jgi:hypothetical protein
VADRFRRGQPDPLRARQVWNVERLFGWEPSVPRILDALRQMLATDRGEPVARPEEPAGVAGADRPVMLGRVRSRS